MNAHDPVIAARDERQPARERGVLGRAIRRQDANDLACVCAVHDDPAPLTGRHPHISAVWGEGDVMGGEPWSDRPLEPRAERLSEIKDRQPLGLGSQRRPQRRPVRGDREVPRRTGDTRARNHTGSIDVDRDDLLPHRVGHVCDRPDGMDGGVARR